MKKVFELVNVLTVITLMATTPALAGQYFRLDLGVSKRSEILEQLRSAGAQFDPGFSYKGRDLLPSIKVTSYDRFNRLGKVREAWLQFDPDGILYLISVTWSDAGATFKTVQDGLAAKYRRENSNAFGFNSTQTYRDGKTRILLERNSFGFGSNQTTTLKYIFTPAEAAVQATKNRIEQEIRQENARKTGGNL